MKTFSELLFLLHVFFVSIAFADDEKVIPNLNAQARITSIYDNGDVYKCKLLMALREIEKKIEKDDLLDVTELEKLVQEKEQESNQMEIKKLKEEIKSLKKKEKKYNKNLWLAFGIGLIVDHTLALGYADRILDYLVRKFR